MKISQKIIQDAIEESVELEKHIKVVEDAATVTRNNLPFVPEQARLRDMLFLQKCQDTLNIAIPRLNSAKKILAEAMSNSENTAVA